MSIRPVVALLALVAVTAVPPALGAQHPIRDGDSAADAVSAIFSAISHADTATLHTLLGHDLHWILASSGAVASEAQLVGAAAAARLPMATNEFAVDSVQVRRYGDIAIAEYRLTNPRAFRDYRQVFVSRASDVLARRKGRWLLVHHSATWIVHSPRFSDIDSSQA